MLKINMKTPKVDNFWIFILVCKIFFYFCLKFGAGVFLLTGDGEDPAYLIRRSYCADDGDGYCDLGLASSPGARSQGIP